MILSTRRLHHSRCLCSFTSACTGRSEWRWRVATRSIQHPTLGLRRPPSAARRDGFHLVAISRPFSTANQWSTIYALSSAAGRAAIAIIRVSGPSCIKIYNCLCPNARFPKPRYAALRSVHDPSPASSRDALLDPNALVLFFPSPKTVTGEDVLEFHVHGGPAVVKAILAAIGKCSTTETPVRYAEPGEFTRRAFLNDRLDLTQVEALGATLSALTEEQRRIAVQGTVSGLAARYESWRQMLLAARGELEALIDFSEDQHFDESPAALASSVAAQVESLQNKIYHHCSNSMRGELLRNGISLSLLGAPNVGKSSLLNQIVGRNAAIVSHEAGTTRDVVEVGIDLGGFFCRLGDTAGLRKASVASLEPGSGTDSGNISGNGSDNVVAAAVAVGEIEQEGMRRARARAAEADLIILMLSIEPSSPATQSAQLHFDPEVLETAAQLHSTGKHVIAVVNKMDRFGARQSAMHDPLAHLILRKLPSLHRRDIYWTSCKDAAEQRGPATESATPPYANGGVRELTDGLVATFREMTAPTAPTSNEDDAGLEHEHGHGHGHGPAHGPDTWAESLGATARQRALLEACLSQLGAFLALTRPETGGGGRFGSGGGGGGSEPGTDELAIDEEPAVDIVAAAEALRVAADCLARITGRGEAGDVEEVLGVVFERFCVGK